MMIKMKGKVTVGKSLQLITGIFAVLLTLFACSAFQTIPAIPEEHPVVLDKARPQCTDCHSPLDETFPYIKYNHDMNFYKNHGKPAISGKYTCYMCHRENFCSECHGGRLELKPSQRKPDENSRQMPHRGDYLSRHQIEGRMNPASCFRCHGNPENAETCIPCHGK